MRKNAAQRRFILIATAAALLTAACVSELGDVPSGGIGFTLGIGNTSITIGLGPAGLFVVRQGTMVQNVADVQPFSQKPTDTPGSASVRLRNSSVTVLAPAGKRAKTTADGDEALTGLAKLRVAVDAPGAQSPCETGFDIGTFGITVENGIVTSVDSALPLTLSVMPLFIENNLSMCLEMQADFDAQFRVDGLDVVFGPSQTLPSEQVTATFDARNNGPGAIHILDPTEDFGPENQIVSGMFDYKQMTVGMLDLVTFRAGRDGTVLDTATCPPVNQGDFYAIVQWDGFTLSCYQPVPEPPAPEDITQVCCLPSMSGYEIYDEPYEERCAELGKRPYQVPDDCLFFGGVLKNASSCDEVTCDEGFEACCFYDDPASCTELQRDVCFDLGGTPMGFGVHCESDPCEQPEPDGGGSSVLPDEACCLDDGTCQDSDPELCEWSGGEPGGPGSACADTECLGACCKPDGCCDLITLGECDADGGDYKGFAIDCPEVSCDTAYTCLTIIKGTPITVFASIEDACEDTRGTPLSGFPSGSTGSGTVTAVQDDLLPGKSYTTRAEAAAACCEVFEDFTDDPAFNPTGKHNGITYELDSLILDECPRLGACCHSDGDCTDASRDDCEALEDTFGTTEFMGPGTSCDDGLCAPPVEYVIWFTGNVCCWGAPWIYITTRDVFEEERLRSSFSGGGIDPNQLAIKVEIDGGFDTFEAAAATICPKFESRFNHYWCGSAYFQWAGQNWKSGNLGCDEFDDLPYIDGESLPDVDVCAPYWE